LQPFYFVQKGLEGVAKLSDACDILVILGDVVAGRERDTVFFRFTLPTLDLRPILGTRNRARMVGRG
jgi:hypothetical protein